MSVLAAVTEGSEDLGGVAGWAVDMMEKLGAPGAGLMVALENLFPPLPSEIILPLAGFTASRGDFTLAEALAWTILGSTVGALALYYLGQVFGRKRMYWIGERLPLVKTEDLEKTEAWFGRHGRKAVFFGRMIPIFRSLISVPAGIERMPMLQFLGLTFAGSAIWNTVFVVAGYQLGENWHRVEGVVSTFQWVVIGVVAVAVIGWVMLRVRSLRTQRQE